MSGAGGGMEERVKLRLAFGGRFQQNPETMTYKYVGGDYYNESLPASAKYADFMFKLSEKLKAAVSVRYLSPGEDLDPEALVTIGDDDDLQELIEEYLTHLHRPGTPSKTFRIRVFAFPATEEALTPDEIMEGDKFFGARNGDHDIRRLQLPRDSSSDWCSTPSSLGSPSVRLASDAEAEYYTSRNGGHSPRREPTHHSALSMYGGSVHQPPPQLSPSDSDMERQALEHFRMSVNNPNFYGGWAPRGSRLQLWQQHEQQQQWQGRLAWQGEQGAEQELGEGDLEEELCCYDASVDPIEALDDDSCYQEAYGPEHAAAIDQCDAEGWGTGVGFTTDPQYALQHAQQQQQLLQQRLWQQRRQQQQGELDAGDQLGLLAPVTPPQPEGLGSGGLARDRGLPADPWDMTHGHQASTTATAHTQQLPAAIATFDAATAPAASTAGAALNLPSHISAFGDEVNEEQQAAAAALAGPPAPLQDAARPRRSTPRTQEFAGIAGDNPPPDASPAHGSRSSLGFVFVEGVVNASSAQPRAADGGHALDGGAPAANGDHALDGGAPAANGDHALDGGALAANGGRRRGPSRSDSGDSAASLPHIRAVHKVPRASVRVLRKIGEGAFGEVSVAAAPLYGTVAIKWLKSERLSKHSHSFWREAGVLAELNHPNVLRFFGVVTGDGPDAPVTGIITEYVRGGSLAQFLRAARAPLPLWLRSEMALHAANGLAYLHELCVVHFDLKPDNLLLEGGSAPAAYGGADGGGYEAERYSYAGSSHGGAGGSRHGSAPGTGHHRGPSDSGSSGIFGPPSPASPDGCSTAPVVKVADFGLSKHKLNNYVSSCRDLRGTLPYMAPELVADPERVSEKADVWSLGVVMWEMLTRRVPFSELTPQQILLGLMCGNLQLDIPAWCEPEWRGLLEACMEPNPASRPSMRDLARQLEAIRDEQQALAAQQAAQLQQQHAPAVQVQ